MNEIRKLKRIYTGRPARPVALGLLALMLAACSGGQDRSTAPLPAATLPTVPAAAGSPAAYTSVAAVGELFTYTFNADAPAYSYVVTASQYGLAGSAGSGLLVNNRDGTYSPSAPAAARIFPGRQGMIVGSIGLTIDGAAAEIPFVGLKETSAALTNDTLNFVERTCSDATRTACGSSYGTLRLNGDGTWTRCSLSDHDLDPTGCRGRRVGTVNLLGSGKWQLLTAGSVEVGTALALRHANGRTILLVDLTKPIADGGFGIGIMVASTKATLVGAETAGNWVVAGTTGAVQYGGTLAVDGDHYVATGTTLSGTGTVPMEGAASFLGNSPWTGLFQSESGRVGLLSGDGLYVGTDPAVGSFEIGLRK